MLYQNIHTFVCVFVLARAEADGYVVRAGTPPRHDDVDVEGSSQGQETRKLHGRRGDHAE